MGRRRGVMSESFKYELAKDLGFYDVVQREGWEGIRTKDAGNMVKRAIQIAEEHLAKQYTSSVPSNYAQPGYVQTSNPAASYNQPRYSEANKPTSYISQNYSQGVYGSPQQGQPGYIPSYPSKAYSVNATFPYQNQSPASVINQTIPRQQQIGHVEQRPYYS
jgi:hypothetical protein